MEAVEQVERLKLCNCGCGKVAPIATKTNAERGYVKGKPQKYARFHHKKKYHSDYEIIPGILSTPCWISNFKRKDSGYSYIQLKRGDMRRGHKATYEDKFGPVPPKMELDHLCRNKGCVNPDHLEPVTHAVNVRRGRSAKINIGMANQIRTMYRLERKTLKEISRGFGISISSVHEVVNNKTWVNL